MCKNKTFSYKEHIIKGVYIANLSHLSEFLAAQEAAISSPRHYWFRWRDHEGNGIYTLEDGTRLTLDFFDDLFEPEACLRPEFK